MNDQDKAALKDLLSRYKTGEICQAMVNIRFEEKNTQDIEFLLDMRISELPEEIAKGETR